MDDQENEEVDEDVQMEEDQLNEGWFALQLSYNSYSVSVPCPLFFSMSFALKAAPSSSFSSSLTPTDTSPLFSSFS